MVGALFSLLELSTRKHEWETVPPTKFYWICWCILFPYLVKVLSIEPSCWTWDSGEPFWCLAPTKYGLGCRVEQDVKLFEKWSHVIFRNAGSTSATQQTVPIQHFFLPDRIVATRVVVGYFATLGKQIAPSWDHAGKTAATVTMWLPVFSKCNIAIPVPLLHSV